MSAWQPIETAPKDGTVVLICGFVNGEYFVADAKWDGAWLLFHIDNDDWTEPTFSATHWMPLPKPPGGGERQEAVRCFMDGIDWEYHLANDAKGTLLFPTERSLRAEKTCLSGGCGVVEVEVSLIRWVEPQDLKFEEGRP